MDHAGHRHERSSSSGERLIGIFTFSPPLSAGTAASDELNEAEVSCAEDFSEHSIDTLSSSASYATTVSAISHSRRRLFSRHSGIMAALSASSSSKKIPQTRPIHGKKDHSKSAECKRLQQSAPVRVPILASAMADRRKLSALFEEDSDVEDDEMLPPHEIVARRLGRSATNTCSMLEGAGRTLKGRDLRQVRNAIWRKTGFLD